MNIDKKILYLIALIVIIAVVYIAVSNLPTDGSSLIVRVYDDDGDPMVGASVELQRGDETFIVLTDSEGNAVFTETELGQYTVKINGVTRNAILYSQTGVVFSYYGD